MNEDITDGYRLSKLPHKRQVAKNNFQLSTTLKAKTNLMTMQHSSVNNEDYDDEERHHHHQLTKNMGSLTFSDQSASSTTTSNRSSNSSCNCDQTVITHINESEKPVSPHSSSILKPQQQTPTSITINGKKSALNTSEEEAAASNTKVIETNKHLSLKIFVNFFKTNLKKVSKSKLSHMSLSKSFSSPLTAFFSSSSSAVKSHKPSNKSDLASTWSTCQFDTTESNNDATTSKKKKKLSTSVSVEAPAGTSILSTISSQLNDNKDETLTGYMYKYNEKTKKWKPQLITLNQRMAHLYFYSSSDKIQQRNNNNNNFNHHQHYYYNQNQRNGRSEKREKGFVDLNSSLYYPVDDSFFSRSFCFQLIVHNSSNNFGKRAKTSNSLVYYLCALNLQSFKVRLNFFFVLLSHKESLPNQLF
jgi:hypothetical protein